MESIKVFDEKDFFACCGSCKFVQEMVLSGPFSNYQQAVDAARDIWFNKVDVNGWLEAFAAHPKIGESPSQKSKSSASAKYDYGKIIARISNDQLSAIGLIDCKRVFDLLSKLDDIKIRHLIDISWSKGEHSTALATAKDSSLQELVEWNACYRQKFGVVFLIFASGRSTPEILGEMKRRYNNRPIVEFEIAAQEQMKITELRLSKLFSVKADATSKAKSDFASDTVTKAGEDRVSVIGAHFTAASEGSVGKPSQAPSRTRPPITTHVLDISRGSPAAGIEVQLEIGEGNQPPTVFGENHVGHWIFQASSVTDKDGRSGQLMNMVDALNPGIYRITFNTGKYNPTGFFPYVSIVFEVRESQKWQHFHVPLLLSAFSCSTYRGS